MTLALAVGAWALSTQAADLPKLDRTVTKEPAYAGKPKYCLLAFGPQAKTRGVTTWVKLELAGLTRRARKPGRKEGSRELTGVGRSSSSGWRHRGNAGGLRRRHASCPVAKR
jgi:hypothetical protein